MGQLIQFPVRETEEKRFCGNCHHAALSDQGVYCLQFNESIVDERKVALECDEYQGPEDEMISANGTKPLPQPVWEEEEDLGITDDFLEQIQSYLKSLHISHWGRGFTIDDSSLPKAAQWFAENMMRFMKFTEKEE